jgi:hypothetical protein
MKLFIPTIGTKLRLTSDWKFKIKREYRNDKFMEALDLITQEYRDLEAEVNVKYRASLVLYKGLQVNNPLYQDYLKARELYDNYDVDCSLSKGTELIVDRIYIRKPADLKKFDSITFMISHSDDPRLAPKKKKGFMTGQARFWISLTDANNIECDVVTKE